MVTPAQLPRLSRRGADPDVRKAREDLLDRGTVPVGVRGMVADSWLRSAAAGVNADSSLHPLAEIFPLLYDVAGRAAVGWITGHSYIVYGPSAAPSWTPGGRPRPAPS